jgi:hypothetical protein
VIAAAIGSVASQVNQSLRRTFRVGEDLLIVSNLTEPDGSMVTQAADKLVLFLVNIEKDALPYQQGALGHGASGRIGVGNAPVHLNLMLMFAATFSGANYPEALKFISHTIGFFQSRPVLDHQNTPDLDPRIDRLVLEIENLSTSDLSNLWSILRGTYLPSVLYRMRMVTIDAHQLSGQLPYVTRPQTGVAA